jgi:hypothetical protein
MKRYQKKRFPMALSRERDYEVDGDASLDILLIRLNPDFVEMRKGSWVALRGRGPDYLRHAGASQRELLVQVLTHLVSTGTLPASDKQGPQIKARLKALGLSNTDAEFASSLANAALGLYQQLNKYTHGNQKDEASCECILRMVEALLKFILLRKMQ